MFAKRPSQSQSESFSKYRAGKASTRTKRSLREPPTSIRRPSEKTPKPQSPPVGRQVISSFEEIVSFSSMLTLGINSTLTSAIITICVGPEQRLFAAHEDVLCISPFFSACCRGQFLESHNKRINLPEEQPEVLSCILEYLYKGDYYPRLRHNKRRDSWELEDASANGDGQANSESTIVHHVDGSVILKDTAV